MSTVGALVCQARKPVQRPHEPVALGIPNSLEVTWCRSVNLVCGLTDPPYMMQPQFCGERKRHIKERNKDNKSLRVSAGQVLHQ